MEYFKKLLEQGKEIFSKLSLTKKIIIGGIGGVLVVAFVVMLSVSGSTPSVVLFSDLSTQDFGQVTKKLEEMGYRYTTSGTTSILVDPKDRDLIMTRMAQEDMIPKGIPGWKLFDMSSWTETDRELDVKYMRALRDEIKRHIESLKNIEKADVEIAISDEDLFDNANADYTAAVTVHLAPGFDKLSTKEIKGIIYLVSRAVGSRLKPEM
jgi:flagellar M-ring protein FliF